MGAHGRAADSVVVPGTVGIQPDVRPAALLNEYPSTDYTDSINNLRNLWIKMEIAVNPVE